MSKRRPSLDNRQFDSATHDHTSQGLLARIINKLIFRNGSNSVLSRMIRGTHGLSGRDTTNLLLEGRSKARNKRQLGTEEAPAETAPSLFSGYSAFMAGEHGERSDKISESSKRGSSAESPGTSGGKQIDGRRESYADEAVVGLKLSAEEFEVLVEDTPEDLVMDVLRGRRGEYTEHLRRLEGVRKQLVQKMRDLDDQIMASSASRKAIDERIAALEQTLSSRNPHPTEDEISAHKEASKTEAHKPTTVEDVNEDSSDDMEYEQDDVPRLRELRQAFSGHYGGITAMDYDADQGLVASGSLDTQVRVWDAATGACKYTISGHSDVIRGVQFYDRFLITGASDGRMRMWDLSLFDSVQPRPSTKIMREEYVAPTREGSSFAHSDDDDDNDDSGDEYDNMMFPRRPDTDDHGSDASNGGRRRMRRPRSPKTIMTLQSTTPPVSPTICHHVPPLELCCENTFVGHKDAVTCFQASYGTLISGGADKTIREWDLSTGQMRQTIDVAWATKDSHAARVASRGLQSTTPWSSPRSATREPTPFSPSTDISSMTAAARRGTDSGDGGFIGALQFYDFALATGTADGVLRLWDMRTAQAHRQMIGHSQPITSLQFDEQTILTGSLDGTAQLWDLRSGKILQTLKYGRPVTSVQVTGGGASFATQCWLAAGDSCLHHYSANSMQRASYASDFGACNSARSKWQMVGEDAGTADVTRVRAMGSDTLLSGDANGVVKLWRI